MQKQIVTTETVADFIARGGLVKTCPSKGPKKTYAKAVKAAELDEDVNYNDLPEALKIKYGIR